MKLLFKQDIKTGTNLKKKQSIIAYFNGISPKGKPNKTQTSTGHKVLAKHFSKGRVINTYEKHIINASLKKMEAEFYDQVTIAQNTGTEPDKSTLIRTIRKSKGLDPDLPAIEYLTDYLSNVFIKKMDEMINAKGELGLSQGTKKNYTHFKNILDEHEKYRISKGKARLTLQLTAREDLEDFRKYLTDHKYATSTIHKRITQIKAVTNHAILEQRKVAKSFKEFINTRQRKKDREDIIHLTEEEVKLITAPNKELSPYLQHTQRIVIIHIALGQRVSDIMLLNEKSFTRDKDGHYTARLKQMKTGKDVIIPIVDTRAIEVIETGLFRKISKPKYNKYIKELGRIQGVNERTKGTIKMKGDYGYRYEEAIAEKYNFLASHTFRRTALSNLFKDGVPEYHILNISGHSKSEDLHRYIGYDANKEGQVQELKQLMLRIRQGKNDALKKT